MSEESQVKVEREEGPIKVTGLWPPKIDIPAAFANHIYITHSEDYFYLVFAEAELPVLVGPTGEYWREEKGEVNIRPIARIAIPAQAMLRIAAAIQCNVESYKSQVAQQTRES